MLRGGNKLLILVVMSVLIAPWVHQFIKPFRLRVDLPFMHSAPSPMVVYHANKRGRPTAFKPDQIDELFVVESPFAPPSPLAATRALLRSARPFSGLRIDPAMAPAEIRIGSLTLHTLTRSYELSAAQLEPFMRSGHQIANVQREGDTLRFNTTGDDPHFEVPLPSEVVNMPRAVEYAHYLFSWVASMSILWFASVLVGKTWFGAPSEKASKSRILGFAGGTALDLAALVLVGYVFFKFVELHTSFDFSQLVRALDRDGVGDAVSVEVKQIKKLAVRNGEKAVALGTDLAPEGAHSYVFQRATEYLYPIRIDQQSPWVLASANWQPPTTRGTCKRADQEESIVLYVCQP